MESVLTNLPLKTLKFVPPPNTCGRLPITLRSHSLCDVTAANSLLDPVTTYPSYPSILGQLSKGIHRLEGNPAMLCGMTAG